MSKTKEALERALKELIKMDREELIKQIRNTPPFFDNEGTLNCPDCHAKLEQETGFTISGEPIKINKFYCPDCEGG